MLTLSRKADYAIVAIAGLAAAGERGASSRELAERFSLPLPLLRNLLKRLARAGVVASTRGSEGGYRIATPLERVSVADLVEAVEGPWRLAACCGECGEQQQISNAATRGLCEIEGTCPVKRPVRRLQACLSAMLEQITLADVVDDRMPARVVLERDGQEQQGDTTATQETGGTERRLLELRTS